MSWKEFSIVTSNEAADAVTNVLNEHGANGVVIEDIKDILHHRRKQWYGELYDIPLDKYPEEGVRIKAYFYKDDQWAEKENVLKEAVVHLQSFDINLGALQFDVITVQESDWENEWKQYFHVQKVTDTITIVPSWETYERAKDEILIEIDPGMAFGTGTHPTTILSLQALEKVVKEEDVIVDVGVGSGILSIAAALLGASHVYGYDLDPVAVNSAAQNRELNQLTSKITLAKNDLLKGMKHRAHIVVSNILAEILVDLVDDAYETLLDGGYFIVSGIIEEKQAFIEDKLLSASFEMIEKIQLDHWVCIIARKKD